ncbi:NACHT domain-containing protein [Brasilonema sp. CT11]|nr:NACHT domain-containing protein [Brasilonema sp. CT11]
MIKLRYFVDDGHEYGYNLEQFLGQQWGLRNTDIKLVLNQGRALVLLDGLDEVTGEAGKQIAKEIKRFARVYPQVQVVVTCRTQSQESRFERFDYVEVADFNEEQVRAFAQHWFETVSQRVGRVPRLEATGEPPRVCADGKGETQARDFLSQLFRQENKPIQELAITPILLSLTCAVFQQTGKFYSKRSKLYEEGLELLLEQWDKSREVERDEIYRDLSVERKLELLSFLAVKKFEQEKYVLFAQEELERYIAEFLGIERRDSRGVLRAIEAQHGLLIERAQKVWSFSHLTFQEYLTTKKLVDSKTINPFIEYLGNKKWFEVISLASSISWPTSTLLLLKLKTDFLLASDKKIQEFLVWLYHKSVLKSVATGGVYKSATIRSIFLQHSFILIDSFRNAHCSLESPFDPMVLGNTCLLNYILGEFGIGREREYSIAIVLEQEKSSFSQFIIDIDFYLPIMAACADAMNVTYDSILAYALMKVLDLSLLDNSKIRSPLQQLKSQLPHISDLRLKNWWQTNGFIWTQELMKVITEHHKIGYYWWLTAEQLQLLRHYYKVNKFLVDCLNNSHELRDELRREFEETLLLPISEIEKRKQFASLQTDAQDGTCTR